MNVTEDKYNNLDEKIDSYVRGGMSDELEIEFEAEFLAEPELLEKVELAQQLVDVLKISAAETPALKSAKDIRNVPGKWAWFKYLAVPQTAMGAALVIIIALPLGLFNLGVYHEADPRAAIFFEIGGNQLRNLTHDEEENIVYLDDTVGSVTLGIHLSQVDFSSELSLVLKDSDDRTITAVNELYPDHQSRIFISLDSATIQDTLYKYEIIRSSDAKEITRGTITFKTEE